MVVRDRRKGWVGLTNLVKVRGAAPEMEVW